MTTSILLATAVVLGLLAFFEPCTIATHTLFSVRAHGYVQAQRGRELITLWLARSAFSVALLLFSVAITTPPGWGRVIPSVALALMASVYLISRLIYIPVPHLEFWRALPRAAKLPQAIKLGLTLPACTLPLFAILVALAITLHSFTAAVAAGLLFAAFFTLPTAVTAYAGLSETGRRFLHVTALTTAYLTALLFYGVAVYLLF